MSGWASLTLPPNDIGVVCQRKTDLGVIGHRTGRGHQDKGYLFSNNGLSASN